MRERVIHHPSSVIRHPNERLGTGHWHQARSVLSSPFMGNLLWLIIVILLILWLGGFAFHVGGGLIHLLLVIAVIVLIFQLVTGRRSI